MGFSRQEYWSGLPFPSPGDLPNPGTEPGSLTLQADSLRSEPPGKPRSYVSQLKSLHAMKKEKKKKTHRPQWRLKTPGAAIKPWAARLKNIYRGKKLADTGGVLETKYKLVSQSVMSNSFRPRGLQHTRLPCPSPPPRACSNSCPSSLWCHPTISSSVAPFSFCPQSFPEPE